MMTHKLTMSMSLMVMTNKLKVIMRFMAHLVEDAHLTGLSAEVAEAAEEAEVELEPLTCPFCGYEIEDEEIEAELTQLKSNLNAKKITMEQPNLLYIDNRYILSLRVIYLLKSI